MYFSLSKTKKKNPKGSYEIVNIDSKNKNKMDKDNYFLSNIEISIQKKSKKIYII